MSLYPRLFENPNAIYIPQEDNTVAWNDTDSIPFFWYGDKMHIGSFGNTHDDIARPEGYIGDLRGPYSGRLFIKYNIITFWHFPENKETLDKLLKELQKVVNADKYDEFGLNIDFFKQNWKIEIPKKFRSLKKYPKKPSDGNYGIFPDWGKWNPERNEQKYVSVAEYNKGYERSKEELQIQHLIPPSAGKKHVPYGFGSKSPKYQSKRQWQMATLGDESVKVPDAPELNESPDSVILPSGVSLTWDNQDAFAFGYYNGNMYMSPESGSHGDMSRKIINTEKNILKFNKTDFQFAGRIWKPRKIMSFWDYPNKKELYKLLADISNITDINFNSEWKIELSAGKIIPIDEYEGSEERSEEDLIKQHVASPLFKPKRKVEPGWGSNSERYKRKREWAIADMTHESFYPRLDEAAKITRKALIDYVVSEYPKKYDYSTSTGRLKNTAKVTMDAFIEDVKTIAKKYNADFDENSIKIVSKREPDPYKGKVLSSKFTGIVFKLNGIPESIVLAGAASGEQMTQTPTVFKEGLVVYFFQTKLTYDPFNKATKDKEQNYFDIISKMTLDIKQNSIKGMDQKDVDYIVKTLETEEKEKKWNVIFAGSIFNAMAIGNRLKKTQFKDWEIYRDKFFNDIKREAAKGLGFAANAVDKWNPMDIMLVRPGCKQQILDKWTEAKTKETEELKLGDYNNIFADSLDTENQNSIALAISLKEQAAQGGKGKSYISKHETVSDRYNLTKDEQSWTTEKFMQEIAKQRKRTPELITKLKEADLFHYAPEQPTDGFTIPEAAKAKYGCLKMLNYLLEKVPEDNMFISLAAYSLSLGLNPTFFKFQGTKDGNPDKVHIYKFPQKGGVSLYNKVHENYDGKILIRDGNNNAGIEIRYFIATAKILYSVVIQIRVNQGTRRVDKSIQVNVEVQKITEIEDLTESQIMEFYPRLFEKFTEKSDPIHDMGIGYDIELQSIEYMRWDNTIAETKSLSKKEVINILSDFENYVDSTNELIFVPKGDKDFLQYEEMYGLKVLYKGKIYEIPKFINETFQNDSDPIEDMGIGAFQMDVEMKGDFTGNEQFEKKKAKSWIFGDIQALKAEGTIDTERSYLEIDLSNDDHIYFEDFYSSGGPQRNNNYAYIQSKLIDKQSVTAQFMDMLEEYGGILYCVLKTYEYILSHKKLKESVNEKFTEESDVLEDLGIGIYDKIKNMSYSEISKYFFNTEYSVNEAITIFMFLKSFIVRGLEPQEAYNIIVKNSDKEFTNSEFQNKVIGAIKNKLNINLIPYYIKESIDEKFTEKSDPIKDMGIGKHQIPSAKELIGHQRWADRDTIIKYQNMIHDAMKPDKSSGYRKYIQFVVKNGHVTSSASSVFNAWLEENDYHFLGNNQNITLKDVRDALQDLWPTTDEETKQRCLFYAKTLGINESQNFYPQLNEKFKEDSDTIQDMGIGGNVNFEKEALKTIRNTKIKNTGDRHDKWINYLDSLAGKSITGVFDKRPYADAFPKRETIKKTDRITFIINNHESYKEGTELYFYYKKGEELYDIYRVLPEEYYLIK